MRDGLSRVVMSCLDAMASGQKTAIVDAEVVYAMSSRIGELMIAISQLGNGEIDKAAAFEILERDW